MDVQLILLYLSPVFLAFIGWEMLYLRKHGAAFPPPPTSGGICSPTPPWP